MFRKTEHLKIMIFYLQKDIENFKRSHLKELAFCLILKQLRETLLCYSNYFRFMLESASQRKHPIGFSVLSPMTQRTKKKTE